MQPWTTKISFHSLFITASDTEIGSKWLLPFFCEKLAVFRKNEEDFSEVLDPWIQSI